MPNQQTYETSYYESLKEYCESDKEKAIIEAIISEGSQAKACVALGIGSSTIERYMRKIKQRQKVPSKLIGKFDEPIKSPLTIKGTSTYYDLETGEPLRAWVKTDKDKEQLEIEMRATIAA